MPENILVVEYEPRYTDRVKQALTGQPFSPSFAKDGEEALRAIETSPQPKLIVLSSVVPKVSASDLIRAIRNQKTMQDTPILLTVSGYSGKSPKADAQRLGASDILPKPYSETEFLGKVQQMLGRQFTSNEIFGDLLEDDKAPSPGAKKTMKQSDDVDKMLADTLAGVMPQRKKTETSAPLPTQSQQAAQTVQIPKITPPPPAPAPTPAAAPPPPPAARAKTQSGNRELDKLTEDTLSGIERTVRVPRPATVPPPAAPKPGPTPAAPPAAEAKSRFATDKFPVQVPDRVPVSSPVFPAAAPAPAVHEEEEPKDGIKFGQYVLLEKIATGGMAEVWKARMRGVEGFQKIVAIKKILPHLSDNQDFIEMFIDEAKLAAQLNHNNIIHIYDLGKIQNSYYIAMEYVDGFDLKTILKRAQDRDQPMQIELALFVASKIAAALDYAHRKRDFEDREMGLVHRDVSPQNVLISEEGDIKLCDFGIAKAASKASHTQAGALKGKLQYMSPEQAWGRHIDKRSDIFALATVLFEMLTGRKLFAGDNELSILEQVREARITAPSEFNDEVSPEIDAVVRKALQKEPEKRYQTAGEMARDLDQILYSFKPTPTSADLAIYMHRLAGPDTVSHIAEPEPFVESKPAPAVVAPVPVATPAPAVPVTFAPITPAAAAEPAKKPPIVPIAIGIAAVIAIVVGIVLMKNKSSAPAAPMRTASAATTTSRAAVVPLPVTPSAGTLPPVTTSATPSSTQPSIDAAKVDAEVRKRLDAERAKLEQQQRTPAPATTARPAPQPVVAAPPPVTPAPQPVVPAPQPVAPPPVAPAPAPTPQPAVAEAPRVHEGDLVSANAEGLTPARLTRQALPNYPPLARQQRIEGTVVMSVLVSENGQVLDTKIISGVNRPVGINEAAQQTIRRSSFAPGMKDGVRVKSWTTVRVDFKL
jgi:TonB family protein